MRSTRNRLRLTRMVVALVVGTTGATLATGSAGAGAAGDEHGLPPDGPERALEQVSAPGSFVTLVTGDRVYVSAAGTEQRARVEPGPGRDDVRFIQQLEYGDVYVIPADAAMMVATGRLDRRLFNVTQLAATGYDDEARGDVPLIVQYADATATTGESAPLPQVPGVEVAAALPSINAAAVQADKSTVDDLWAELSGEAAGPADVAGQALPPGIERVWLDGPVEAFLDRSVPQVGAPEAWQSGHAGQGATVAVLDTGIDATHPDLAEAVVAAQDFSGSGSTDDLNGHGTHVASTIAGDGAASDGRFTGVAPDADLMVGKVMDDTGMGQESWVIAGMQWAAHAGADVVNMSLGGPYVFSDGTDPMSLAVDELTAQTGTLFAAAAGNMHDPYEYSVASPAVADSALAVGAVSKSDELADFSRLGPRIDESVKPDITAPGVDIVAARAKDAQFGEPGSPYVALSGTSMATPHVAGAAAILAAQHPDWTATQLKAALMGTAVPNGNLTVYQQGAGRLDVARAVRQTVTASPANISLGRIEWPHDDEPVTRTITYHNDGTEPVALDIGADVRDESGRSAPEGLISVTPDSVVVPASGSADISVTVDARVPAEGVRYGGFLTATTEEAGTTVRTPVGLTREPESYELTIRHADRSGNPASGYFGRIVSLDQRKVYPLLPPFDGSGTFRIRLPKGAYYIEEQGSYGDPSEWTFITEPHVELDRNVEFDFDLRDAKPIGIDAVDRSTERPIDTGLGFLRDTAWGATGVFYNLLGFDGMSVRPSSTRAPAGQFSFVLTADLAEPDGSGGFAGSPYLYRLRSDTDGRVPTDLLREVRDRDLARVTSVHAGSIDGRTAMRDSLFGGVTGELPFTLAEFHTPDVPVHPQVSWVWGSLFYQLNGFDVEYAASQPTRPYPSGVPMRQRWNTAVFGPAFPSAYHAPAMAGRSGDEISLNIPLFTEQGRDRVGFSAVDAAHASLHLDGELVGELSTPGQGNLTVPGGDGLFELAVKAARHVSDLSTRVEAEWAFRSDTVTGDPQPLPLMAIRFAPGLDDHNRAPSDRVVPVPVQVQRNGDAAAPELASIAVQASYDDGATWRKVRLVRTDNGWNALVEHPRDAAFVSLMADATDSDGNTVRQTIIRAYSLG